MDKNLQRMISRARIALVEVRRSSVLAATARSSSTARANDVRRYLSMYSTLRWRCAALMIGLSHKINECDCCGDGDAGVSWLQASMLAVDAIGRAVVGRERSVEFFRRVST